MRFVFRVDSSTQIGTGHVMRCLTLADALRDRAGDVVFICRSLPGNLSDLIEKRGFKVFRITETEDATQMQTILREQHQNVGWLIADHYGLDYQWESKFRSYVKKIMVIDDLANRRHDCDLLLDQNISTNQETRYDKLVSEQCQKLIGAKYLLLRPEFLSNQLQRTQAAEEARKILITMGGSDPHNLTSRVMQSLVEWALPYPLTIRVAVGASCPYIREIQAIALNSNPHQITVQQNVSHMAQWMAWADLAISAGGFTCYELAYMGVPTAVLVTSPTQLNVAQELHRLGITYCLGEFAHLSPNALTEVLKTLMSDSKKRLEMSQLGQAVFDGYGIERVIEQIFAFN